MTAVTPLQVLSGQKRLDGRDRPEWLDTCIADGRGRIVPNLANVLHALRHAPELVDAIGFDEMLCAAALLRHLPLAPKAEVTPPGDVPRPVRDEDVSQLQEWLQHEGLPKVGKETVHQAVDQRARECAFHPVRDYLEGLIWDGVARLDYWLVDCLGAEPSPYVSGIGRMFMIAMIARIFKRGARPTTCSCSRARRAQGSREPAER